MKTETVLKTALAGLIALSAVATPAFAAKGDNEKCAGVAKASKNDCGTSKSACAGSIKTDRDAEAWIFVPKGTCEKIAGGTVVADKADAKK